MAATNARTRGLVAVIAALAAKFVDMDKTVLTAIPSFSAQPIGFAMAALAVC